MSTCASLGESCALPDVEGSWSEADDVTFGGTVD